MTLSSHEPFETPAPTPFTKTDLPSKFRSAAWYTDKCLGEYFEQARKQPWYNNTLFVLVADHGHLLPLKRDFHNAKSRRIPLLILGGALKEEFHGKKIAVTGNQNDIASTVLHQLQISATDFKWSNNLLNISRNNFAYLCMDDAIGWVNDSCSFIFNMEDRNTYTGDKCITDTSAAKAYLQVLYEEFLKN
jgi:phosphoglycerol transferase MdoB-like AlkP superfamily enzyme